MTRHDSKKSLATEVIKYLKRFSDENNIKITLTETHDIALKCEGASWSLDWQCIMSAAEKQFIQISSVKGGGYSRIIKIMSLDMYRDNLELGKL